MKTKNILRTFLAAVFVLGTLAMNAQTKIYVHKSDGTADGYTISEVDSISFTPPVEIDYSVLVINEVDGIGKFVEIYNNGAEPVSLKGLILVKNESQTWWTGGASASIAAGGFYTISQTGQSTECASEAIGASGISPKQNVKFELKKPNGTDFDVIDQFVRSNGGAWGDAVTPAYDAAGTNYSFSRVPDGTGNFQLTVPSCNAPNNPSQGDIVTNP